MKNLDKLALSHVIVASIFICPPTEFQNRSDTWTEKDQKTYEITLVRCGELHPDAPCVKMFRKVEDGIYSVICGYKMPKKKVEDRNM